MLLEKAINKKNSIFIIVTHIFTKEEDGYIAKCSELGIYSQGNTLEEAEKNILDAVRVYLNSMEAMGLRDNVFKDKDIKTYKYAQIPKQESELLSINPEIERNSFYRKVPLAI